MAERGVQAGRNQTRPGPRQELLLRSGSWLAAFAALLGLQAGVRPDAVWQPLALVLLLFTPLLTIARAARGAVAAPALASLLLIVSALLERPERPGLGLFLLVWWSALAHRQFGWKTPSGPGSPGAAPPSLFVFGVEVFAALVVLFVGDPAALALQVIVPALAILHFVVGLAFARQSAPLRWGLAVTAGALGALAAQTIWAPDPVPGPAWLLPTLMLILAARPPKPGAWPGGWLDLLGGSAARIMVVSFAGLCALGSLALAIPLSAQGGPVPLIDAAFTAVSATCVTGLSVFDVGSRLSGFGQVALLLLIQVGGLGMMTFAAAATVWLGGRLSVVHENAAADLLGGEARKDLRRALEVVLWVTCVSEALGAICLFPSFLRAGHTVGDALWQAVFTAISAFCNAGFALKPDSLMSFREDPWALLVVSALIVVGGLGPAVVVGLPRLMRGRASLHARLVVATTLVLLVAPTPLFLAAEWNVGLAGLGPVDRVVNAFFQAVTARTAGFNSLDMATLSPASWTTFILLMFVGGSPASTAGGVKTTTIAVVLLAVLAAVRGEREVVAFGRRLPHRVVYEAAAITTVGVLAAAAALLALQLTQDIGVEALLFEVVSALATVGLSIGATAQLDQVGKLIVMVCMFAGRVGPLTLFLVLATRERRTPPRPPIEAVPVG